MTHCLCCCDERNGERRRRLGGRKKERHLSEGGAKGEADVFVCVVIVDPVVSLGLDREVKQAVGSDLLEGWGGGGIGGEWVRSEGLPFARRI